MSTVYVVDLSNNNGQIDDIDFGAIKRAGYTCVILKASEGVGFRDPRFVVWAQRAHAVGLVVGAYHFLLPYQDAGAQAALFNSQCSAAGVPIAVRCCDAETGGGNVEAACQTFCPAAQINLLYSGAYFAHSEISQPIPGVEWWIASYGTSQRPSAPWGTEAGWQFTSSANVPGVPGQCDESVFDSSVFAAVIGSYTPEEAMGAFNLIAVKLDPARPVDHLGRHPFWGLDAKGELFAFNGARGLGPSPIKNHNDIVGWEYLPSIDALVVVADDGHAEAGEPGGYGASTFEIHPAA